MQNLVAGYDPTGVSSISGANLKALIEAATPYSDIGMVKVTTDTAGVPDVPDAVGTPELVRYVWLRILATSALAYVWVPSAASDATYLKWQSITISAVPDGAITNAKLGAAAVTDSKVNDVAASKITGAMTNAQLPLTTLGLSKINAKVYTTGSDIDGGTAANIIPYDNTLPQWGEGAVVAQLSVTPLTNTAYLRIRFGGFVLFSVTGASQRFTLALFQGVGPDAIAASAVSTIYNGANNVGGIYRVDIDHLIANPGGTITWTIRGGPGGATHVYFNRELGVELFSTAAKAWLTVEEFNLGALS